MTLGLGQSCWNWPETGRESVHRCDSRVGIGFVHSKKSDQCDISSSTRLQKIAELKKITTKIRKGGAETSGTPDQCGFLTGEVSPARFSHYGKILKHVLQGFIAAANFISKVFWRRKISAVGFLTAENLSSKMFLRKKNWPVWFSGPVIVILFPM